MSGRFREDREDAIWEDQRAYTRAFLPDPQDNTARIEQTRHLTLGLSEEIGELLRTLRAWKIHRKDPSGREISRSQLANDLTDLTKYVLALWQTWGFTPDEILDALQRKSAILWHRYSEEFIQSYDNPMVIFDLDGVLADYRRGFLEWINRDEEAKTFKGWITAEALRMSPEAFRSLQTDFREYGGFATLPVLPGVKEVLQGIASEGVAIVALTSRPIDDHPRIYGDTLEWFKKHDLPCKVLWWSHNKADKIEQWGVQKHVLFAVEDDLTFSLRLARLGVRVLLHNCPDEGVRTSALPDNVTMLKSLTDIVPKVKDEMLKRNQW